MKFTETHEWIEIKHGIGTVGVTDYAQRELGDIVYVELPKVGKAVKKEDEVVVLESTKAAAVVYAPISGIITTVNTSLSASSELVNTSPEGEGWLFKIEPSNIHEMDILLNRDAYTQLIT